MNNEFNVFINLFMYISLDSWTFIISSHTERRWIRGFLCYVKGYNWILLYLFWCICFYISASFKLTSVPFDMFPFFSKHFLTPTLFCFKNKLFSSCFFDLKYPIYSALIFHIYIGQTQLYNFFSILFHQLLWVIWNEKCITTIMRLRLI